MSTFESALTYTSYLAIDELLDLQRPVSEGPEHDELLFIIIHQTYELWFKQVLHEMRAAQRELEAGNTFHLLPILGRIRTIFKVCVAQVDILETMTPLQFNSFRGRLESSSGFQSAQFRELEAVCGRRDSRMASHLPLDVQAKIGEISKKRSIWDSALVYITQRGKQLPQELIERDFSEPYSISSEVQDALVTLHKNDPEAAMVFERLLDIDEGLQEWRYRHVKMVERTIGRKSGTGGSSGVDYLASTLFHPIFPDLWQVRDRL